MKTQDMVCLSHLRWDFVYQRPQHLISRSASEYRVWYVEEPVAREGNPQLHISHERSGVRRVVPFLPDPSAEIAILQQQKLLEELLAAEHIDDYILWYYTPMALAFSGGLNPSARVYDCMDELSVFQGAPPAMISLERQLLHMSDLVFTGGRSLYEAKKQLRDNVHCFPSAVDVAHFQRARTCAPAADHASIPRPRIGFAGVIDERMDLELVAGVAEARPEWQLVFVGPVTKIDESQLPRAENIHYLGARLYDELPACMAAWDVAMMPFALNEATRFISPTKTPEYLAAGLPVVSTAIRDVVESYERSGLARIATDVPGFVAAIEAELVSDRAGLLQRADACLSNISWDRTWSGMQELIQSAVRANAVVNPHAAVTSITNYRPVTGMKAARRV